MIYPQAFSGYQIPVQQPLDLPTPIYGAMLAIWQLRPMLQRWFPLYKDKITDHVRFLGWCVLHGRKEYGVLRELPEWDAALNQPVALPPLKGDAWGTTFTVGMFLMGVARHRNTISHLIGSVSDRRQFALAYWRGRRHDSHMPSPPDWQLYLLKKIFNSPQGFISALRRPKGDAGKNWKELAHAYGLEDIVERMEALPDEIQVPNRIEVDLPIYWRILAGKLPVQLSKIWKSLRHKLTPLPSESQCYETVRRIRSLRPDRLSDKAPQHALPNQPFGVNLFGYAKGELGIGEDVRMVAQSLKALNIPFCIINVKPGSDVSQHDTSADGWISDKPLYAINLFCMTGIEQVRFFCEKGTDVFRGRYTIGLWPWELPAWPRSWMHAYATVDEIWGISQYTADAYQNAPVPVQVMPLAVSARAVADIGRSQYGLPESAYLFFYAFDFNSSLSRKNPEGLIDAFQRAFPRREDQSVGLVLKASHVRGHDRRWRRLLARIKSDPRIHLINRMIRRPELLALFRSCDCYVSLHRAEGFGRTIAEALLLGRQVICTGYSGNMDFCKPERTALVRYDLRALKEGEYFYCHGQNWAEPEIHHAAELMHEVMQNPRSAESPGFDYGFPVAGQAYKSRLEMIYSQLSRQPAAEGR